MSHKLRLELSCVEGSLLEAIIETKMIMKATQALTYEIKVFLDINRQQSGGFTFVTIHQDSRPEDVVKIYKLEKASGELKVFKG